MRINFTPQRRDDFLIVSKSGETLTINGDALDFAKLLPVDGSIPDYETDDDPAPPHPFVKQAKRVSGELTVTLILPHGPNPSEDEGWPKPIEDAPDGVILDQPAMAQAKLDAAIEEVVRAWPSFAEKSIRVSAYAGFTARTEAGMSPYRANAEMLGIVREWQTTGKLTLQLGS